MSMGPPCADKTALPPTTPRHPNRDSKRENNGQQPSNHKARIPSTDFPATTLYDEKFKVVPLCALQKFDPIPSLRQSNYSLRNQDVIGPIRGRTERFQSSFYPNCISEWNKLDPEIRLAPSVAVFKTKLLSRIRPPPKSVFGIHDPIGLSYL